MDYLQEGIGLRAMAQRDPLVEYQREGFLLFQAMTEAIKEESVGYLFQLEVEVQPAAGRRAGGAGPGRSSRRSRPTGQGERRPRAARTPGLRGQGPGRPGRKGAPLQYSAPTVDGESGVEVREEARRAPASDEQRLPRAPRSTRPCPCGSGKKYKRCHGATRGRATPA